MSSGRVGRTLSVGGLILFGTTTSLLAKIVYELQGEGRQGVEKYFRKPWAMTTVMFLGMTFCLPLAYFEEYLAKKRQRDLLGAAAAPLLAPQQKHSEWKKTLMLAIPTVFDLIATVLMNVGLLSVTASVYQMMRGAEMLFAALFAVLFLKRNLNKFHYGGILCCVVGIALVGISSVLSGEGSQTHHVETWEMLVGMGLIVASQAVQAGQITFEDFFMSDASMQIAPLKIVGFEGLFGSLMMIVVMLPICQLLPGEDGAGFHEDTFDTLHMIFHTPSIAAILVIDMFALLMYNVSGMSVTGYLGAVFRTVLETMRTLFVWLVDLLLFYTPLGMGKLGESWTPYSVIQALGFVVLVSGTLIYGRGDDEETKRDAAEYIAAEGEEPLLPASGAATSGPAHIPSRGGPTSLPIALTPASLKSTMNIASYSQGLSMSYQRHHSAMAAPSHGI